MATSKRSRKRRAAAQRVSAAARSNGQVTASAFGSGEGFGAGGSSGRGGYAAANRNTRRTRGWNTGEGSPVTDILGDLPALRGRSRDLERNHSIALGAIQTKTNGVIGGGLKLRSVLDASALGLTPQEATALQYDIEREWELFEREADFTGQMHLKDIQRLAYHSARVSGDIGIARRFRKRRGDAYGTRVVLLEADRISNKQGAPDTPTCQGGVEISRDGEILGYWVTDRHPADTMAGAMNWAYVPKIGPATGLTQFLLAAQIYRPGQLRGVPLFAPVEEDLKQLGDYSAAELKAAVNDAYLFATEEQAVQVDDEGNPIVTRADGEVDESGELTLDDLTITTLSPGSKLNVKSPARPNTAFGDFVDAYATHVGVALGLPKEVLLMKFTASFSASRGALELAWKNFQVDQDWFVRSVLDPIREWQFTEMVSSGRFSAPGFFEDPIKRQAWLGRVWVGPTRIQINPQVEANADEKDLKNGLKTREQIMTERTGGDFDTKSRQWLRENEAIGAPGVPAVDPTPQDQNADGNAHGDNNGAA